MTPDSATVAVEAEPRSDSTAQPPSRTHPLPLAGSRLDRFLGLPQTRRALVEATAVGALAMAVACWLYRVWAVALTIPFRYSGDALLHAAYVQRLQEDLWYLGNDRLGAPHGLDARDFPLGGENAHWLALKALGWVLPTPGAAMNAYLIIGYGLIAAASYMVVRAMGLRRWTAVVVGLLFAFLPFHQWRGVSHMLRSGYYIVPLVVLAVYWLGRHGTELRAQRAGSWWGMRRDRLLGLAALGVALGASDTQNAVYGSILMVFVGVAASAARRDWRPLAVGLAFTALAGSSVVANNAPFLVKRFSDGPNTEVAQRALSDLEHYALRPAQLVLPISGHRLGPLAELKQDVRSEVAVGEDSQALGLLGSIGFVVSLVALAALVAGSVRGTRIRLMAFWGLLTSIVIAIATPQGLSFLLGASGFTMLRTWNRMSLFIAFFSLLVLAMALEALADRAPMLATTTRFSRRTGAVTAAFTLVVVGILDQTPPSGQVQDPGAGDAGLVQNQRTRDAYLQDQGFYRAVEDVLPAGAMVYQFPFARFPEGGHIHELGDYQQLTAYLHTTRLTWSAAAMSGRPEAEWQVALLAQPPAARAVALAAAGFDGAVVYRRAYGPGSEAVEPALGQLVGAPAAVQPERGLAFYDLRPLRERLEADVGGGAVRAAAAEVLEPVSLEWGDAFYDLERIGDESWRWSSSTTSVVRLLNPSDTTRSVTVSAAVQAVDAYQVAVSGPFGEEAMTADGATTWRREVEVPPGGLDLRFTTDGEGMQPPGPDDRHLTIRVIDLTVSPSGLVLLLCGIAVPGAAGCDEVGAPTAGS